VTAGLLGWLVFASGHDGDNRTPPEGSTPVGLPPPALGRVRWVSETLPSGFEHQTDFQSNCGGGGHASARVGFLVTLPPKPNRIGDVSATLRIPPSEAIAAASLFACSRGASGAVTDPGLAADELQIALRPRGWREVQDKTSPDLVFASASRKVKLRSSALSSAWRSIALPWDSIPSMPERLGGDYLFEPDPGSYADVYARTSDVSQTAPASRPGFDAKRIADYRRILLQDKVTGDAAKEIAVKLAGHGGTGGHHSNGESFVSSAGKSLKGSAALCGALVTLLAFPTEIRKRRRLLRPVLARIARLRRRPPAP
jgi:hypothetical protein